MKKLSRDMKNFIMVVVAYVLTFALIAGYYLWVENENKQVKTATLTADMFDGEKFSLPDFDVKIGPRGGDSGAWLKDPILDEDGNELHGPSVGIIYEMIVENTSKAVITDWEASIDVPELMWFNNGWNGTIEFFQQNPDGQRVQNINLKEYNSVPITLDYYIDHTGPMIRADVGDKFVYHPSKADNEMPLYPKSDDGEEVKYYAIVGYIVYIPDQGLDYQTVFDSATFSYHLERSAWDEYPFIVLVSLDILFLVLIIGIIMSYFRVRKLLKQQKHDAMIIEQSINTLIHFVEAKDPNTKGHSERVANISYALAKEMGYSLRECNNIKCIALMHDCGKIAIPSSILQKPDKLTREEYETIKRHTTVGGEMLRDFTSIPDMSHGALYHHERYDGMGYPKGISGEEIPLIARIICAADALDAMNSNRCYRPRLEKEVILSELEKNKGKQFDPEVIDYLLKLIKQGDVKLGE